MSMADSPPFAADDSPPGFVIGRSLNILGKRVFLGDATFTRHATDWRGLGEPLLLYQQFERPITGTPQGGNHLTASGQSLQRRYSQAKPGASSDRNSSYAPGASQSARLIGVVSTVNSQCLGLPEGYARG
jgi:hypothetical protein